MDGVKVAVAAQVVVLVVVLVLVVVRVLECSSVFVPDSCSLCSCTETKHTHRVLLDSSDIADYFFTIKAFGLSCVLASPPSV